MGSYLHYFAARLSQEKIMLLELLSVIVSTTESRIVGINHCFSLMKSSY